MNRTFWAGFGVALVVLLLPILILIDARSSDVSRKEIPETAATTSLMPSELAGQGENRMDEHPSPPSSEPIPVTPVPDLPSSTFPPSPQNKGSSMPTGNDAPEIVFSPDRIRRSVEREKDHQRGTKYRTIRHSGIREIVYDTHHVYTIRTAVSHVTLIDLPEEAKEVYLGDAKLFLAEVFGSRVKVKPITYDLNTTTNMIVYTVHKQFAFRLKVVSEGEEDDLLTFYSPRRDTVVNLNPIKAVMEHDLAAREKTDLREKALSTLKESGPSVPYNISGIEDGVTGIFLGFSRLGRSVYALFEIRNETHDPVSLTEIRLRMFRTSLFWDGERDWQEGQDFSQSYRIDVPPHARRRVLLLADPPALASSRDGYLAELRVDGQEGKRRIFSLEARGGGH